MAENRCRVLFMGRNRASVVIPGLREQWLALSFILFIDQARVVMIHVCMAVQRACNGRIDSRFHLKGPLVRIAGLLAKLKPGGRAIVAGRETNELDRSVVEIIMDPIRVAVEILDSME